MFNLVVYFVYQKKKNMSSYFLKSIFVTELDSVKMMVSLDKKKM